MMRVSGRIFVICAGNLIIDFIFLFIKLQSETQLHLRGDAINTEWSLEQSMICIFRHSRRKAHTLRPAVQAQSSDFTLTITKNSIYAPRK